MSQQSVRQAARRSALDAQAVLRKERADRQRRLEALAVAVLTALGERDALVRDASGAPGKLCGRLPRRRVSRCVTRSSGAAAPSLWRSHPATPTRGRPAARQRPMSARDADTAMAIR